VYEIKNRQSRRIKEKLNGRILQENKTTRAARNHRSRDMENSCRRAKERRGAACPPRLRGYFRIENSKIWGNRDLAVSQELASGTGRGQG